MVLKGNDMGARFAGIPFLTVLQRQVLSARTPEELDALGPTLMEVAKANAIGGLELYLEVRLRRVELRLEALEKRAKEE